MSTRDFIFSDNPTNRLQRHLCFWGIFSIGFYIQSIVPVPNMYMAAFASLCFYLPFCILSVYICLSYLLPFFLEQKKYKKFLAGIAVLVFALFILNYIISAVFYKIIMDKPISFFSFRTYFGITFINTSNSFTIGVLAMGLKFSKSWYKRQKDNIELVKQKIINDVQLEKSGIYPSFINHSLENLYVKVAAQTKDAPAALLHLSDVLSYILYDSTEQWVTLNKELSAVKNLIDIEKPGQFSPLKLKYNSSNVLQDIYITPMVLFSFFVNMVCINKGKKKLPEFNTTVLLEENMLSLLVSADLSDNNYTHADWENFVTAYHDKMGAFYPGVCRLELYREKKALKMILSTIIKNKMDPAKKELALFTKKESHEY